MSLLIGVVGCSSSTGGDTPTPPPTTLTLTSATVPAAAPNTLVLVFSEAATVANTNGWSLSGTSAPTISAVASGSGTTTVTFTLSGAATYQQALTLAYSTTGGTGGAVAATADSTKKLAAITGRSVTNNVAAPPPAPTLVSATITTTDKNKLVLVFSEAVTVPAGNIARNGWSASGVTLSTTADPTGVGTDTWTFTLTAEATSTDVTVSYTTTGANAGTAKGVAGTGTPLAAITARPVYNQVQGTITTAPTLTSAVIGPVADQLKLTFNQNVFATSFAGWSLTGTTVTIPAELTDVTGLGTQTVTLKLSAKVAEGLTTVADGQNVYTVYISYAPGNIKNVAEIPLAAFNNTAVNTLTVDNTPPKLVSAILDSSSKKVFTLTFSEKVTATSVAGWKILSGDGHNKLEGATLTAVVAGNETTTLTLTVSNAFNDNEVTCIRYVEEDGNVKDLAGNKLADIAFLPIGIQGDTTTPKVFLATVQPPATSTLLVMFDRPVLVTSGLGWTFSADSFVNITSTGTPTAVADPTNETGGIDGTAWTFPLSSALPSASTAPATLVLKYTAQSTPAIKGGNGVGLPTTATPTPGKEPFLNAVGCTTPTTITTVKIKGGSLRIEFSNPVLLLPTSETPGLTGFPGFSLTGGVQGKPDGTNLVDLAFATDSTPSIPDGVNKVTIAGMGDMAAVWEIALNFYPPTSATTIKLNYSPIASNALLLYDALFGIVGAFNNQAVSVSDTNWQ